jgi:D-xylose 1-dehydrogenase (NADP+, D-xylono-1,5-lactone-forming)
MQTIRLGILGTAKIARAYCDGARGLPGLTLAGVASRSLASAQAFADSFQLPQAFGSYEALLADPSIDAIYLPLPNSLHAPWAIAAMQAGKHVLCEKPLAGNAAQARDMAAVSKATGKILVEAYPYRWQAQTIELLRRVRAGELGQIQLMQASFAFPMPADGNIRLDPHLAGGALLDAGSYPVSLAVCVLGTQWRKVQAFGKFQQGVDTTLVGSIEFEQGAIAQIAASFATSVYRHASVIGTHGSIETRYSNHAPEAYRARLTLVPGDDWSYRALEIDTETGNGFYLATKAFCACIRDRKRAVDLSLDESIAIAEIMDALKASAQSEKVIHSTQSIV